MKKTIFLFFVLYSAIASAQLSPSKAQILLKPALINTPSGGPLDYVSMFNDTSNFIWRDFQSLAEVQAYAATTKFRTGRHLFFVNEGGTLNSNGTFTGGVTRPYIFAQGTTNAALVPYRDFLDAVGTSRFLDSLVSLRNSIGAGGSGGSADGNNFTNGGSFANNTLTLTRSGLSSLGIVIPLNDSIAIMRALINSKTFQNTLLTGAGSGQSIYGGAADNGSLILYGTSSATAGASGVVVVRAKGLQFDAVDGNPVIWLRGGALGTPRILTTGTNIIFATNASGSTLAGIIAGKYIDSSLNNPYANSTAWTTSAAATVVTSVFLSPAGDSLVSINNRGVRQATKIAGGGGTGGQTITGPEGAVVYIRNGVPYADTTLRYQDSTLYGWLLEFNAATSIANKMNAYNTDYSSNDPSRVMTLGEFNFRGGGVNMYNSNGTLLSNRIVSGNNLSWTFGSVASRLSNFTVNSNTLTKLSSINSTINIDPSKIVISPVDSLVLTTVPAAILSGRNKLLAIDSATGKVISVAPVVSGGGTIAPNVQVFSSGTTWNIAASTSPKIIVYVTTPDAPFSSGTIVFPSPSNIPDGQEIEIRFGGKGGVTSGMIVNVLTLSGNGSTIMHGTETGPTYARAGTFFAYTNDATFSTLTRTK